MKIIESRYWHLLLYGLFSSYMKHSSSPNDSMDSSLLNQVVFDYIGAVGPVSFADIMAECRTQVLAFKGESDNYLVAAVITGLIRDCRVELYDDGISFTPSNVVSHPIREHDVQP